MDTPPRTTVPTPAAPVAPARRSVPPNAAAPATDLASNLRPRRRFRPEAVPAYVYAFGVVIALIVLAAIFAPLIAPHEPFAGTLRARLDPPFWMDGGSRTYPLGTDKLGQDVLSRIIYGARTSLTIGVVALLIGGTIGTIAGLVAGYFGKGIDEAIMTVVDIQLAFPFVLLAIAVIAVVGAGLGVLIVVVGLSGWVTYARVARARVLSLKEIGFIEAIRSVGAGNGRILLRHILPNTLSRLIVLATLELARLIILEATLSFLGLGVPPRTTPSWGSMIGEGREYLGSDQGWWISVFPGLALFVTALGISRIGDWVRDALDPTMRND
jgi:peptide/nickel transport system permease protein